jgi:5-methylcytosine-specific restriction endonuclease McrA
MPCDYSKYPADWHEISRRIRFERAGNCCEWCGARNYQPHPETGSKVVLTVAHLNHDVTDNRESNLAALCQACHNRYDAPKRAKNARKTRIRKRRASAKAAGQLTLWKMERLEL